MPVTVHAYATLTDDHLRKQIERIYETSPEFADGEDAVAQLDTSLARGDVLYTAEFNDKVIGAIWSRGDGDQLLEEACKLDAEKGVKHFRPGCGAIHRMLAHLDRLG